MSGLGDAERKRMTVGQQESLSETRSCPMCSGTLERTDVSKQDSHVIEAYRHVGGAGASCPGHDPSNGLFQQSGTRVEHWIDGKSVGTGALEGEFDQ